jgi:hypothetical protein
MTGLFRLYSGPFAGIMRKFFLFILLVIPVAGLSARLLAADAPEAAGQPTPYLSPEEEAKTIILPEGYRLELVLSDPIIKEPVVAMFDGNGRMFVAEMRSYMQDIDGNNEITRAGRVSLHWSSKGNGVYNRHSIFADNLVLPRMILPVADGLLVNETDSNDIWLFRDTNGDGVADTKTLLYAGGRRKAAWCGVATTGFTRPSTPTGCASRGPTFCGNPRLPTAASGASIRMITASFGSSTPAASKAR